MKALRFMAIAIFGVLSGAIFAQNDPAGVPADLTKKLTNGVNVTRWFCYPGDPKDTGHFESYFTEMDFHLLKRLHVSFVRLCISPEAIYEDGKANKTTLVYLDAALDRLEKEGLAVLVDLHDNGQMKLDAPDHDNAGFVSFWEDMATHYRGQKEGSIVFELLNEPQFLKNPEVWYALQERTVRAIRKVDADRSIMVASTSWNGVDTFAAMKPLPQRNLIYSFHCYDPFQFTHQGASWTGPEQQAFKNVPFPSSPEAVAAMIDQIPEQYRGTLKWYGDQRYDDAYLLARLSKGVQWARANHVPVILGEFGAYPPVSPPASRANWFRGMRKAMTELKLGHAIWGYDDALGLGRQKADDGTIKIDMSVVDNFYR